MKGSFLGMHASVFTERRDSCTKAHNQERAECFGEMTKSWIKWGHRGPHGDESKWGSVMEGVCYMTKRLHFSRGHGAYGW